MDQQTVMTVFVVVAAIALVIQAGMLFGMYRASRALEENARRLVPKIEALVATSQSAVDDSRKLINEVNLKTGDILDLTRKQLALIDDVLQDAAARARVQFDRAELVLDDTMTRAQETVALVQSGIMKPLREIHGVIAGVRSAFSFLMRGRRPDPADVTADEEMFI
jgi:hypothetical protein